MAKLVLRQRKNSIQCSVGSVEDFLFLFVNFSAVACIARPTLLAAWHCMQVTVQSQAFGMSEPEKLPVPVLKGRNYTRI